MAMTTPPHISVPRWRPSLKRLPVSDVGEFNVAVDNLNSRKKKKLTARTARRILKRCFDEKCRKLLATHALNFSVRGLSSLNEPMAPDNKQFKTYDSVSAM